jgi:hypothetical protein
MKYSKIQLEALWVSQGGSKSAADVASAVALAESGGDPQSTDNDSDGSVDRGLWQINSVHGAQSTYSVTGNTKAAIAISNNGTDWSAWVTYNSGAYKKFLGSSALVTNPGTSPSNTLSNLVDSVPGGSTINKAASSAASEVSSVANAIGWVFSASGADRILKTVGGGLLVLLALNELLKAGGK